MDGILGGEPGGSTSDGPGRPGGPDAAERYGAQAQVFMSRWQYAEAEPLLRAAVRLRPESPDLLNSLGSALWEQGKPAESEPYFRRASALRPEDCVILNNLGLACWDQGRPEEAAECYRRVLQLDPAANNARMNLGVVLSDIGHFDEALEHLREAVRVEPNSPDTVQNLGMTLGRIGEWDGALACYNQALEIRPNYAEVHRNRGYGWLYVGDFERGWPEHEWRLRCRRHRGCRFDRPVWRGEPLNGQAIILHAEQGLGDTLMFIRYASLVKQLGGLVFVLAHTPLLRLVARCPGVDLAFDGTSASPDCRVHAPLMSLPAILGTTLDTVPDRVPYLPTEPLVVERWRRALDAELASLRPRTPGDPNPARGERPFLVGIAWQGSPQNPLDRWRSYPLASLAPVADVPGVCFVRIQSVDGLDQIAELNGRFPIVTLDSERPRTFVDTAAILSLMDLVITPDTAVAHLAGGLGVPVWLGLSTVGEWRWMVEREDSPWYPTMRIFRQTRFGDWDGVFRRMADVLRTGLAARATAA
ncbi:MAG: tetratricopeptide repeat protein [Isosphaeraceae bacterium]